MIFANINHTVLQVSLLSLLHSLCRVKVGGGGARVASGCSDLDSTSWYPCWEL